MTKEEGNKLIAEFMEGRFYKDTPLLLEVPITSPAGNKITCVDKLKYHSSWDWLMPVVEKIESTGCIVEMTLCLAGNCKIIKGSFKRPVLTIANFEASNLMAATYLSAIAFIEWYNKQKH